MFELLAQVSNDVTVSSEGAGWLGGGMAIVILLIGLVCLAIWIWALIDAIRNPALESTMRIVWLLVIFFTGIIGAIIYLLIGRSRGTAIAR